MKNITLRYFASLKDHTQMSRETCSTQASRAKDLYEELKTKYNFSLHSEELSVAINGKFAKMDDSLTSGDEVVFIPPVSGG